MAAIFGMTWVVKPKEIAYQSQTERFEHLLTKLNLSDGQGKFVMMWIFKSFRKYARKRTPRLE